MGKIGIWWSGTWEGEDGSPGGAASEMEQLGYRALWSSGGFDPGLSPRFATLLGATERAVVASGIVSIWHGAAPEVAGAVAQLEADHPGRFLLGLGASHAPNVERIGVRYERPYSRMVAYLDELDAQGPAVAPDRRVLAALGPRMLELAAARSAGAHPYFVPVEHVGRAREILGPDPLLAPEIAVVLDEDPSSARAKARSHTARYLEAPNYTRNLRSFGFGDEDFAAAGSDRLIDAIVAWGTVETVARRVQAFLDAGADHVAVQVVADHSGFPFGPYRALAPALVA